MQTDDSTKTQIAGPTRKLQRLGKIGRVICILSIIIHLLLTVFFRTFYMSIIDLMASILPLPEINNPAPAAISLESWKAFISSVLPYLGELYLILGIVLVYTIFNSFAHAEILTHKVAKRTLWFGIWLLMCFVTIIYNYSNVITGRNEAERITTSKVTETFVCAFEPIFILAGLFVIALGLALSYAADIKEESSLTI